MDPRMHSVELPIIATKLQGEVKPDLELAGYRN